MKLFNSTCPWCHHDMIVLGNHSVCVNCGHPAHKSCRAGTAPQRCPRCNNSPVSPDALACPSCHARMRSCSVCKGSGYVATIETPIGKPWAPGYDPSFTEPTLVPSTKEQGVPCSFCLGSG